MLDMQKAPCPYEGWYSVQYSKGLYCGFFLDSNKHIEDMTKLCDSHDEVLEEIARYYGY